MIRYGKPLLESGTTGTKSNHEVILPNKTSSYNDGAEAPEVGIAMCTLRSFPYLPLHCIEFAKQKLFTEHYVFAPEQYERFRKDMVPCSVECILTAKPCGIHRFGQTRNSNTIQNKRANSRSMHRSIRRAVVEFPLCPNLSIPQGSAANMQIIRSRYSQR